jgi:N-acetylmuramoyl-L-alanine amidase
VSAGNVSTSIDSVRVWPAPDNTRIVFDLSAPTEHKVFTLDNPFRLVIDISDATSKPNLATINYPPEIIRRVRTAPKKGGDLRVVFDLVGKVKPRSFMLSPNEQYGDRLVLDLYPIERADKPVVSNAIDDKRDVVIAIDAGHGGEDPGAIGAHGIREKNVVLAISRELEKLFKTEPGYKPVLIRESDYYVNLRKRNQIARKHNADMMISIHADAFRNAKAKGASVYALSKRGASSETARWLAESENRADLIGGVGSVSLDDKDNVLAGVLLDLSMTASMRASVSTGREVVKELGKVTRLHKKQIERAGFVVLKSPDVPSILVETGFISNPGEARKLNTRTHQRALAKAIFKGVTRSYKKSPPPGTYLAWQLKNNPESKAYRIARGDTLSEIAERNNVNMAKLKHFNGLTSNHVQVGQVLQIPSS